MDLSPYVESVREGVANAAALADEHSQQVALKLGAALESSTRLALIQALSDAAGDISAELAPASVDLRMSGGNPQFVVSVPETSGEPTLLLPQPEEQTASEPDADLDDEPVARISLRLPSSVKNRVDEAASADGISTNAWLMRAVMDALGDRRRGEWPQPPQPPMPPLGVFGPNGPFGPHGPFGPNGLFGEPGDGGRNRRGPGDRGHRGNGPRGNVQGWVR
ncbi:hypothetical protein GCM10009841_07450 [Microlunatus panaciterrae]|uniref:HicB family protein n=1 Tax=Microlunatus panaciterrae TaxID=400768 RepID=A0ABS2RKA9_9ACTN|nr:hypothetical protein [Microlunatus panaciterrae]MBM7798601.1 hypothetical protein [Microlunatus panaciterrae]